jgi:hypothetical protein
VKERSRLVCEEDKGYLCAGKGLGSCEVDLELRRTILWMFDLGA